MFAASGWYIEIVLCMDNLYKEIPMDVVNDSWYLNGVSADDPLCIHTVEALEELVVRGVHARPAAVHL